MKNMLCYIGMLLAIVLIAFPPVLRAVLPDKVEEKEKVIEKNILICTSSKYIVSTTYEKKEPTLIMFKKISGEDLTAPADLDNLYDSFQNDSEVVYTTMEDGEIAQIDLLALQHENLTTKSILTSDIDNQKIYYENLGLLCSVS